MTKEMKPRDRVLNALSGLPVDRTPVANPTNIATVELMDLVGAPFPAACQDPNLNAELAATGYTELGFDSISPYFSIIQESAALGCEIQWEQKDNWPTVRMTNPIWDTAKDVKIPKNFLEHRDTKAITKSIEILKTEYGKEAAIIGKTMGPWTLAYHVFGVEKFLLMSIDDPSATMDCLNALKEISVLYGQAQIDSGADVLTFPDHATGDLVSGEYYDRYLKDMHAEFVDLIPCPLILHICGRTVDRMNSIAETGMAAFHFDSKNKPQESMDIIRERISLVGNINNPETLYAKEPDAVHAEVCANLDAGVHMVGPECAIPLQTSIQNLLAIPRAVREWHAAQ